MARHLLEISGLRPVEIWALRPVAIWERKEHLAPKRLEEPKVLWAPMALGVPKAHLARFCFLWALPPEHLAFSAEREQRVPEFERPPGPKEFRLVWPIQRKPESSVFAPEHRNRRAAD